MKIPWDWDSKAIQIATLLVIVLLLFAPLFLGLYIIYVNPPLARGEYGGEDTFVSSLDPSGHSTDPIIRISNYTDNSHETVEIGFFEFDYTPWPGGGSIIDVYFSFSCDEVLSGGLVLFHTIENESLWSPFVTDLANLTYASMPSYHSTPFTTTDVTANGTYTVKLSSPGGPAENHLSAVVVVVITAEQGVRLLLDSLESSVVSRVPRMVVYQTIGLMVRNPLVYYLHPLSLVSVLAAAILTKVLYQKVRARKTAFTPS